MGQLEAVSSLTPPFPPSHSSERRVHPKGPLMSLPGPGKGKEAPVPEQCRKQKQQAERPLYPALPLLGSVLTVQIEVRPQESIQPSSGFPYVLSSWNGGFPQLGLPEPGCTGCRAGIYKRSQAYSVISASCFQAREQPAFCPAEDAQGVRSPPTWLSLSHNQ